MICSALPETLNEAEFGIDVSVGGFGFELVRVEDVVEVFVEASHPTDDVDYVFVYDLDDVEDSGFDLHVAHVAEPHW